MLIHIILINYKIVQQYPGWYEKVNKIITRHHHIKEKTKHI